MGLLQKGFRMKAKFTKRYIENLKPLIAEPGKDRRLTAWDTSIPGLICVVSSESPSDATGRRAKGQKTFFLTYRHAGRRRKVKIGIFGSITVEQARKRAKEILADLTKGSDPAEKRDITRKGMTVEELAKEYIDKYARPRKRTWKEDERYLSTEIIPFWGKRKASSITRKEIVDFLERVVDRGSPIAANRLLAVLRKMFGWAVRQEKIPTNPAAEIDPPSKEKKRQRVLSDDELKIFLVRLPNAALSPIAQLAIRMLVLTGQRTGEILNMEWDEVDLKKRQWKIPGKKTKNGKPHLVPLSPQTATVLNKAMEISGGKFCFSKNPNSPMTPTVLMRGIYRSENKKPPVFGFEESWTVHDLRRTAVTGMARLEVKPHIIERVVNHAVTESSSVAGVYNVYSYEKEKRAALKLWADHIDTLLSQK